jgi:hypothetical protein
MTAVQARLHYAFKQELRLLSVIIRDYTDPDYDYDPDTATRKAKKEDYEQVDIIPVSDPNAATMSQRVVQYQAVIQMAQMAPDIYDLPQLHRNMLDVLGIKNADKLVPLPDDQKPKDPVTENMAVLRGEPLKAFIYQDHESHIKVHSMMMQDPLVMESIGQNPKAPQMQAALTAHIAEHTGYRYRQQIEQQLGLSLPPEDAKMPPEAEMALSSMMAQAAQQVLQQNQANQQQQQAQQQSQDPVLQMQQQELQIKQQELQLKQQELQMKTQQAQQQLQQTAQIKQQEMQLRMQQAQTQAQQAQAQTQLQERKLLADATAKSDQMELEQQKASLQMQLEGMKLGNKTEENKRALSAQQQQAGVQMGIDVAKSKAEREAAARLAALNYTKEKAIK